MLSSSPEARLRRAIISLEGLSIGDALGHECFFFPHLQEAALQGHMPADSELPPAEWPWTDDSSMAFSIVETLAAFDHIDQDALAGSFARYYDRSRGYGPAMHGLLMRVGAGADWRSESTSLFDGMGSYGNGSAMRVAPVGAYFADDLPAAVEAARLSAQVTHTHREAAAGAIAVAVAAALACRLRAEGAPPPAVGDFIEQIINLTPEGEVQIGLQQASQLQPGMPARYAARTLGNGGQVTCMDTVPLAIYAAANFMADYRTAFWETAGALGDIDTNCAIVGGIVACYTGLDGLPKAWRESREAFPAWFLPGMQPGSGT